jgi:hypothetical protein
MRSTSVIDPTRAGSAQDGPAPAGPGQRAVRQLELAGLACLRPFRFWPGRGWMTAWYAGFAVFAGVTAVVSGASYERSWGLWAVFGYALAALAAGLLRGAGRTVALVVGAAGALVAPTVWLAVQAAPTPDVEVVMRAATLLLQHGNPYLPPGQIAHISGPIAYNPYLPGMALFGMPSALGATSLLGDSRLWLVLATVALFIAAFRAAGRRDALRCTLFAVASPVVAFPLALGITDPPMLALVCLALALLSQPSPAARRLWAAAVAVGLACAMKYTAWPALPVIAVMLAARDGWRAAARFAAIAVGTAAVLFVACAPAAFATPSRLIPNTVLFPLGLTRAKTPAASPLLGHLLASTGSAGQYAAIALLLAAGLAVAVSLLVRPPRQAGAAALRLALGLALIFALSPATRFGYFGYPIGLCGWLMLCGAGPWRAPDAASYPEARERASSGAAV